MKLPILLPIAKLKISIGLVLLSIFVGTMGYIWLENYPFLDALYMTIITLSTIGYGETRPLSDLGRVFTIFFIVGNIGIFAYCLSTLSLFIIEGSFKKIGHYYFMRKKIENLQQHIIVCGYGRYGKEVCDHFLQHNIAFVIIEDNPVVIAELEQHPQLLFIQGNATHDETLDDARIAYAKGLVSTLPTDADNVYVVLTARQANPDLNIISRAEDNKNVKKLYKAGANEVLVPERIGGFYMSMLINKPDVVAFFNLLATEANSLISFEEIVFKSDFCKHLTIRELQQNETVRVNIIGIRTPEGKFILNPPLDTTLMPNMRLIFLGERAHIEQFKNLWRQQPDTQFDFL